MGAGPETTEQPRSGPGEAGVREVPVSPANDGLRAVVEGNLPHGGRTR
ncbi:uncharacterized protein METZ01_LOCUS390030 [marine metagenome]|uniref:Uncharacterized protein n=1 Tax=marine metagenome TaxID=408172 RepID=A0A382USF3_9ZZZZ